MADTERVPQRRAERLPERRPEPFEPSASGADFGVSELAADGETALQRLAGLLQLIDYAAVYLGIAIGVDPGPVGVISDLKERIA